MRSVILFWFLLLSHFPALASQLYNFTDKEVTFLYDVSHPFYRHNDAITVGPNDRATLPDRPCGTTSDGFRMTFTLRTSNQGLVFSERDTYHPNDGSCTEPDDWGIRWKIREWIKVFYDPELGAPNICYCRNCNNYLAEYTRDSAHCSGL